MQKQTHGRNAESATQVTSKPKRTQNITSSALIAQLIGSAVANLNCKYNTAILLSGPSCFLLCASKVETKLCYQFFCSKIIFGPCLLIYEWRAWKLKSKIRPDVRIKYYEFQVLIKTHSNNIKKKI